MPDTTDNTNTSSMQTTVYTARDHIFGCVDCPLPPSAAEFILSERGIDGDTPKAEMDRRTLDLLRADTYVWLATTTPYKMGGVTDKDNSWEHSDDGFTLTEDDKQRLLAMANGIYEMYDEPLVLVKKKTIRLQSHGIMRANRSYCGDYVPRITKGI